MQKAKSVREAVAAINTRALSALAAEERKAFLRMLRTVIAAFDNANEKDA